MTAFEVARRLVDEEDPQSGDVLAKIEASIQTFGALEQKVEQAQIASSDQTDFLAYFVPVANRNGLAPAVICISREGETAATLLGRLLPTVVGRGISVLVVSHDDVSSRWRGQSKILLSGCLDYLLVRPDVDTTRIGIYGEGLSASLATDFAVSDRRVAAASCDGGLWNWTRTLASVGWMTRTADRSGEDVLSSRRLRLIRQLRCPVLVVAGGRNIVSAAEAIKLQADCTAARIDLEVAIPRIVRTPAGEIENFVTSDESIFGWLRHKLTRNLAP
ncbi:alpha/beta hydrolase [Bradyrhizobium sp. Arg62]|uniref:alpha/beta hydrolase family protein n=1 Tax=Bradyrhizobium brasilense TaxID=1419277 RepID=UPI001E2E3B8B|nr:alpha/beta hydrolase [Bradyrhizobium brasilense]MCC8946638.1 alpha/beta hydrolase [Bradyrhizobium brasilense]